MGKASLPKSLGMEWAMTSVRISAPWCVGRGLWVVSKDLWLLLMAEITTDGSLCHKELKAPQRPFLAPQLLQHIS